MRISIRPWKLFAVIAVPVGILGCGEDSESARGPSPARATTQDPSGRVVVSQGRGQLEGVDDQDDPAGPSALPRSDDATGWIKTQPVRIALADELESFTSWEAQYYVEGHRRPATPDVFRARIAQLRNLGNKGLNL